MRIQTLFIMILLFVFKAHAEEKQNPNTPRDVIVLSLINMYGMDVSKVKLKLSPFSKSPNAELLQTQPLSILVSENSALFLEIYHMTFKLKESEIACDVVIGASHAISPPYKGSLAVTQCQGALFKGMPYAQFDHLNYSQHFLLNAEMNLDYLSEPNVAYTTNY